MGFYMRKGFSMGPIRLNLSKSGIGMSFGVKGARISAGPRGAYINLGRDGFYYRQRLDSQSSKKYIKDQQLKQSETILIDDPYSIKTANVNQLMNASCEQIIIDINSRLKKPAKAPFAMVFTCFCLMSIFGGFIPSFLSLVLFIIGIVITFKLNKSDVDRKTSHLLYELDETVQMQFSALEKGLEALSQSDSVWRITIQKPTLDWKKNAGATSLLTRNKMKVCQAKPPFLTTNIQIYEMNLNDQRLLFFPDNLYVYQSGKYAVIPYNFLSVSLLTTRFIENERQPHDADVVGTTWLYANKNGGPDKRFKNNRQLPIMNYSEVNLTSVNGLNIKLNVSSYKNANIFVNSLKQMIDKENIVINNTKINTESVSNDQLINGMTAYEILGILVDASSQEIHTAYKQKAQMYHPDKVAHMAPEFKELAETKMKEINKAYNLLAKKIS